MKLSEYSIVLLLLILIYLLFIQTTKKSAIQKIRRNIPISKKSTGLGAKLNLLGSPYSTIKFLFIKALEGVIVGLAVNLIIQLTELNTFSQISNVAIVTLSYYVHSLLVLELHFKEKMYLTNYKLIQQSEEQLLLLPLEKEDARTHLKSVNERYETVDLLNYIETKEINEMIQQVLIRNSNDEGDKFVKLTTHKSSTMAQLYKWKMRKAIFNNLTVLSIFLIFIVSIMQLL